MNTTEAQLRVFDLQTNPTTFLPHLQLTYLPPPWGECESKALESGFFQVYSVTACRIDCETRYIVENCNCRMVHMPGKRLRRSDFSKLLTTQSRIEVFNKVAVFCVR